MFGLMAGGLMSAATTLMNNAFANKRAESDRAANYMYGEMAAGNADARARRLYQDLQSPEALLEQYRKASLSPSLMLGNGGGVSGQMQQGAQGSGAAGIQTHMFGLDPVSAAQVELMHAEAQKTQAETQYVAPVSEANIADLLASAGNKEAATAYTKSLKKYQDIQNEIADETKSFSISKIKYETNIAMENATKAFWEAQGEELQFQLDLATFEKRKETIAHEAALLAAQIAYTQSGTELNEAQKNAIAETILQSWAQVGISAQNATSYADWVTTQKEYMPEQLRLRGEEINLQKWKIGVDAITGFIQTGLYLYGMSQFGRVGQGGNLSPKPTDTIGQPSRQWTPARHGAGGRWTQK